MANSGVERGQTVLLQPAENLAAPPPLARFPAPKPPSPLPLILALLLSLIWLGGIGAFLWGFYGVKGLISTPPVLLAGFGAAGLLPPILFLATAWVLMRSQALSQTAIALAEVTDRLFTADETAARTAARLGRAVRRELDTLNTGLDSACTRLQTLETALQSQIGAIDEAGAHAQSQAQSIIHQLTQERARLDACASALTAIADQVGTKVTHSSAEVERSIARAEAMLKAAGASLDQQTSQFHAAVEAATQAPHTAAAELDQQARRIEALSEAMMARSEFVLERHQRHRAAIAALLDRLKDEGMQFEAGMADQRRAMEETVRVLTAEAAGASEIAAAAHANIGPLIEAATVHANSLATAYGREAERLRQSADTVDVALTRMVEGLSKAGGHATALIAATSGEAKEQAKALVSEAMGECQRLSQASALLAEQTAQLRRGLDEAAAAVEKHLLALPGLAKQEAARVRQLIQRETDEMLDLSARTLATIQARNSQSGSARPAAEPAPAPASEDKGDRLLSFAGRLTMRPRRKEENKWEMSQLLAAAEASDCPPTLTPSATASLSVLQGALADLAIDFSAIYGEGGPCCEDWQRYLAGDRGVFASRLAKAIDRRRTEHIAALYHGNARFHEAANIYLEALEILLAKAHAGDGAGLLDSALLTGDNGKIYLALAYALGRLEPAAITSRPG